ncbi:hypothetical protein SCB71_14555 [Herbiconiux sp. KACC 21604]|uniref:hypothetical protein n=1 Tax=unclassified Herbiconiux TaxID=2618217 RepID=UPI0014923EF9|nr:hypothetical protein [Herbiconiux sp. SALV-R1]QJU54364.1 hypothetical protein HL652_12495 [Herbiconiux sp. SALV-R1]WPO85434.1 hypothetical protein SCB71_14555 [Herbiconiux sp. KACC 21604]
MMQITEQQEVSIAEVDWNDDGRVTVAVHVADMAVEQAQQLAALITVAAADANRAVTDLELRTRLDGLTAADRAERALPCAWCDAPSRGGAFQFGDGTYPERSCGAEGHGFRFQADEEAHA